MSVQMKETDKKIGEMDEKMDKKMGEMDKKMDEIIKMMKEEKI